MTSHLSTEEMKLLATRKAGPDERWRMLRHLEGCAHCRRAALALESPAALARTLRAVREADPHLTYAQLEAYVEARIEATERGGLDRHLAGCARCQGELADFRGFAADLARPVSAHSAAAGGIVSWIGRWLGFDGTAGLVTAALRIATLTAVAIGIAILVPRLGNDPAGSGAGGSGLSSASYGVEVGSRTVAASPGRLIPFDPDQPGLLTSGAKAALAEGSAAAAESELRAKADREVAAAVALALLQIDGKLTPREPGEPIALLTRAAGQGNGLAAHTLGVVAERGLLGRPVNAVEAANWYRRAADLARR